MRILTSVSSMVVLALTTLSLTSCGKPGIEVADLNAKEAKVVPATPVSCLKMITGNMDIKLELSKDGKIVTYNAKVSNYTYEITKHKDQPNHPSILVTYGIVYKDKNESYTISGGTQETAESTLLKPVLSEPAFQLYKVAKCSISSNKKTKTLHLSGYKEELEPVAN